eukprot:jgi/Antlo1/423/911
MLLRKKGMRKCDSEKLSETTLQVLKDPDTVTSDDFMTVYNIIYKFCTQPTSKYEIKGAPIYDILVEVLSAHTSCLESFSSIESFNCEFQRFEKAAFILSKAYEYLERYYIKVSVMKGGSKVRKIKDLFYFYYYTNYVDKLKFVFENMVLLEITRIRREKTCIAELKAAMNTYWTLLICSDQENRYTALKELYVAAFKRDIHYNEPINRLISIFCRELLIASEIFDTGSYEQLSKRMVLRLDARSGEIVDYILGRIEKRRTFRHAYKILEIMSHTNVEALIKKLESYIDKRLELCTDFDTMFGFYFELTVHVESGFNRNKSVRKAIKVRFHRVINTHISTGPRDSARRFIEMLVHKVDSISELIDKEEIKAIVSFFGLVDKKELVMEKVVTNLQKRLILESRELDTEKFLLTQISGVTQHEDIFRAKISVADMVFSKNFCTTSRKLASSICSDEEDADFIIEPKFLTSGFWNFEKVNVRLIEKLSRCKDHLVNVLRKTYKRSSIEFNYAASAIILEFRAFRIVAQTDVASILLNIESCGEVSLKRLEHMSEDSNLIKNLRILVENGLVNATNNVFSINYGYSGGDLNLFSIAYLETGKSMVKSLACARVEKEMKIEAEVMRLMKKTKICRLLSLVHAMQKLGFCYSETTDAIKNLVNNSYIEIDGENVRYVP